MLYLNKEFMPVKSLRLDEAAEQHCAYSTEHRREERDGDWESATGVLFFSERRD